MAETKPATSLHPLSTECNTSVDVLCLQNSSTVKKKQNNPKQNKTKK